MRGSRGGRRHAVDGGLSRDPDSCTTLCAGGERRFSSFISLRAEMLIAMKAGGGKREKRLEGPVEKE